MAIKCQNCGREDEFMTILECLACGAPIYEQHDPKEVALRAENENLRDLLRQARPWLQEAEEDNRGADTYDLRMELETLLVRIQQVLGRPAGQEFKD